MNWLKIIALLLGTIAISTGIWALVSPEQVKRVLKDLPRNQTLGRLLMAINFALITYVLYHTDLRDWNWIKRPFFVLALPIYIFVISLVNHYLGARSIALFLLIIADPVLQVCFLREERSSLVITTLAYIWITLGICFFAVPHWFRDWISIWTSSAARIAWGGRFRIALGVCLILLGLFAY
jgi:hypothetical protein